MILYKDNFLSNFKNSECFERADATVDHKPQPDRLNKAALIDMWFLV